MNSMTIGKLAKAAGVPLDTVRHYEKVGLLAPPRRSAAGYRHYDRAALERLGFIAQAKSIGFTLSEIADLLSINARDTSRCAAMLDVTEAKLTETRARIAQLSRMKRTLRQLTRACPGGDHPLTRCPIVAFLRKSHRHALARSAHQSTARTKK